MTSDPFGRYTHGTNPPPGQVTATELNLLRDGTAAFLGSFSNKSVAGTPHGRGVIEMHTPQDRDSNGPTSGSGGGSTASQHTAAKAANDSGIIRLTAIESPPSDLLADDPANTDDFPTVITPSTLDVSNPALMPGSRLGSYELIEAIGAGGMATVLKARDVDLGRVVALKILPPVTARDGESVRRFKLEARAAAKLDHDNIARVYFCGEDRGLHFIAFEFVEGENLRQRIDRLGRISSADAVHYLLQLSAGLAHAAERGVIHRDIKPSNILITPDGRAKIVDMGLARHLEGQTFNGGVTQSGVTLGTFDYISPEQALDPRRADIRSDIYSLGCAFYHALTGRPPVPEGTAAKKLHAHEHDFPTDPRDLNPAVSDGLAMVLAKMMAKQPGQRYQTPADLTHDLTLLLTATSPTASSGATYPSGLTAQPAALPLTDTLPRMPLVWLTALALVAVASVLYFAGNPTPPQSLVAPWQETAPKKIDPPAVPTIVPPVNVVPRSNRLSDARGLAESLARQGEKALIQLKPGTVYDLTLLPDGIQFTGTDLVIEPEPGTSDRSEFSRPVLRLFAVPPADRAARPGTLGVRGAARFAMRGIEVQIVERPTGGEQLEDDPIGLLLTNVARTEIDNCLIRTPADSRKGRTVGIAVEREGRIKPGTFALRHSVVDVGVPGIGLRIVERTETDLSDVGFGPHQSAVLWVDAAEDLTAAADGKPTLTIQSCTFMLDRGGAALTIDQRALCSVALIANVFADVCTHDDKPTMPGDDQRAAQPVVLRADPLQDLFRVYAHEGQTPNACYHVLPPAGDARAIVLTAPPWAAADPRLLLVSPNPWPAFQLNLNEKRLRVNLSPHVLGMVTAELPDRTTRPIYDGVWPPPKPSLPVRAKVGQRVVHPDAAPEDASSRVYPTVAKAYEDLKPGETLLIAQNGKVPVSSLPEKALRATIAPFEGFSPILVPSEEPFRRADASLFPLVDGELTLVGLHVQLAGRSAVVTMAGGTTCTVRDCTILLEEKDDEPASLIVMTEPTREMKVGKADPANPRIHIDNTLVHGRGKVMVLRAPRAFEWTADNAAFALEGTILQAEAALREVPPPRATIKWKNVTVATTGSLVELRGNSLRVLGLDVSCDRCLLASCTRRRAVPPMVLVQDADGMTDPSATLTWRGDNANVYGNYDPLLEVRGTGAVRSVEWDATKWLRFTGESGRVGAVRFASPNLLPAKLRNLKPDDLRAELETSEPGVWRAVDAGADPSKLPKVAEKLP